jgi:hypothetical protein
MIRPSSLPALGQCPKFEGDASESSDAHAGTVRHQFFAALLKGEEVDWGKLSEADAEGVAWAVEYVRVYKPDLPLVIECRAGFTDPDFNVVEGTPDVICGDHLFDLKWRPSDYSLQLAAYVMMVGTPAVTVHVLFAERKRAERYTLTRDEAWALIVGVLDAARRPEAVPTPCEYCGWCSRRLTCPALLERANAVVEGRPDWALDCYHPGLIDDPADMGKALRLARLLKEWIESVEHHAKDMAIKAGMVPHGFQVASRAGKRELPDVAAIFAQAGLPQAEFLRACEVSFTELALLYAEFHGQKKKPAERELEAKLGALIQRRPSVQYLTAEKA